MADILIVEDEVVLARSIVTFLERRGFSSAYAVDIASGKAMYEREKPHLVIVDYKLEGDDGLELLSWIRGRNPEAQVVVMTGHGDVDVAVKAMKAGARDFLVKPAPLAAIAALARDLMLDDATAGGEEAKGAERIVGRSSVATELRSKIRKLAALTGAKPFPGVLIVGLPGVGKATVAQALHDTAFDGNRPFMSIDCSLRAPERSESIDLIFERVAGGSLLLRNVDALPMDDQSRLVNALSASADDTQTPWLLATTTSNLAGAVRDGKFRSDLLYRIQVGWVDVPALRERSSDILPVAEFVARRTARRYGRAKPRFSSDARARLLEHDWPGNVTELVNCVERATFEAVDDRIGVDDIRIINIPDISAAGVPNLKDLEERAIGQALKVSKGNVSRAAAMLGISRDTMRYRMDKYGLSRR